MPGRTALDSPLRWSSSTPSTRRVWERLQQARCGRPERLLDVRQRASRHVGKAQGTPHAPAARAWPRALCLLRLRLQGAYFARVVKKLAAAT